jgi:ubiquinone/menaquinone biosynthesis C-methylase UbiE
LTFEIADRRIAASIDALDYKSGFVEAVNTRKGAASINVRRGVAMALPYESAQFEMALSLLVLHFLPNAVRAICEMVRVVKPGGVVATDTGDEGTRTEVTQCPLCQGHSAAMRQCS